ncbi:MAG TPA: dihydropteroate synthase [Bacteroidia bacterium]|jgi:dihydropteroate synthase|nr:dihydropteroate synthase [Bacteroidia bacterium]
MGITTIQTANRLSPLKLTNGKELSFDSPLVMGIVNITPDSFYDGGKYENPEDAIKQAEKLLVEGADIIDLGAASTRPKAIMLSPEEELERLLPVLDVLTKTYPDIIISVDTFHALVAKEAVEHGALIINDISGGTMDEAMLYAVAGLNVPYIIMHMQGTPETMQVNPQYDDVLKEVYNFLSQRVDKAQRAGIKQMVIDPGFGFGKTVEHNYTLLRNLGTFRKMGLPLMAGVSRKSMINKVLKTKPENALTGTISLNTLAVLQGANILRVHDVKEAKQVIKLVNQYLHPDAQL